MAVAFSPDGKVLASSSRDAAIKLWDPCTGRSDPKAKSFDGVRFDTQRTDIQRALKSLTDYAALFLEVVGDKDSILTSRPHV